MDRLLPLILRFIGIEPMRPLKGIPAQVTICLGTFTRTETRT